jgi:hypothetical protein
MKRSLGVWALIGVGVLVDAVTLALATVFIVAGPWVESVPYLIAGASVSYTLGSVLWQTRRRPIIGRAMWVGPIDGFLAMYADGTNPFTRWGITRGQRVEVRVVHDTVDEAFALYTEPTAAEGS